MELLVSETDKLKHIACLGCRIRRRKCDGLKPICTGCVDLNIPVRLCVYHDARVGYKSDKAGKTLEKLKSENQTLKIELQRLKSSSSAALLSHTFDGKRPRRRHRREPYLLMSDNRSEPKRNPLTTTIRETSGIHTHYGPLSWHAIASTNEPLKNISAWIINVVKLEKDRYDRAKFDKLVEKNTKLKGINDSLTSSLLEIESTDSNVLLKELLVEIGDNLPSKDLMENLLHYYFRMNDLRAVGFVYVDQESFFQNYCKYLDFDSKGAVTIRVDDNREFIPFVLLLLALLTFSGVFISKNTTQGSSRFQINHMLMVEYLETLLTAVGFLRNSESFSFISHLCPESLMAMIHLAVFERCTPHGSKSQGTFGISDALTIKQLLIYAKRLNLDKDIDTYHPNRSENYKKGLKSIWSSLVYHDISEGLETGIDLKVKSEELILYEFDSCPYVRSLVVMNRVLNDFNEKVCEISGSELTDHVEKKLISQLDTFLANDLTTAASDLHFFQNCDFDDLSNAPKYVYLLQMSAIKLMVYSLSQSLYQFCTKMAEQNNGNWRRYELLGIKKGATLMQYLKDTIESLTRLIFHDNADNFSLVSSLQVLAKQVTFSLRRCTLFGGELVLKKSDPHYAYQVFNEFMNDSSKYSKSLMDAIVPSKRYEIFSYTVAELEDLEIEKDLSLMKQRLSHLFESKFLVFKLARMIQMVAKALDNDRFNLNFIKLNYVFFYCSSASNLFLSIAYPPGGQGAAIPKKSKTETLPALSEDISNSTSSPTEFNFNQLFQTCIDTTSENFDFKTFFTGSTDLYHSNDFDEFFQNLSLPQIDNFNIITNNSKDPFI